MRFREAVAFAYAMDWPLNIGITITWTALETAGEHNEGHCLGRGEWGREKYARDELARLCRSEGLPFVALWGRDVGADMGSHVHLSMFWPSRKLAQLVTVIERISGSSADFVLRPYAADVVARSVCGGWQVNMNSRKTLQDRLNSLRSMARQFKARRGPQSPPSELAPFIMEICSHGGGEQHRLDPRHPFAPAQPPRQVGEFGVQRLR